MKLECVRSVKITSLEICRYMVIPAVLCILLFAFLQRRRNLAQGKLDGRPGLPLPLNFLDEKRNRFLFVGGFCVTIRIVYDIVIKEKFLGISDVHFMFSFWVRMIEVTLLGIVCYPIFGGFASEHVVGYGASTLYVLVMTTCFFLAYYPCENVMSGEADHTKTVQTTLEFIEILPWLCCMTILCLVYAYRFFVASICGYDSILGKDKESEAPYLIHVRRLLKKHLEKPQPEKGNLTLKRRLSKVIKAIYEPIEGFRYSVSILSGVLVSIFLAYCITCDMIKFVFLGDVIVHLNSTVESDFANESEVVRYVLWGYSEMVNSANRSLHLNNIYDVEGARIVNVSAYLAVVAAFLLTSLSLLSMLRQHRKNLLHLFQGNFTNLPTYKQLPRTVIVDGIRYLGYQFTVTVWGYLIQCCLLIIGMSIASVIAVIAYHNSKLRLNLLGYGAIIVYAVVVLIAQSLVVYFCFLLRGTDGRRVLAIDNRSWFDNFNYFMVFANATMGLVACMKRVAIAAGLALWTLPRLDHSSLSRDYEKLDRGFTAYVGLLRMENALTNPTMLAFVHVLTKSSANPTSTDSKSGSTSDGSKSSAARRKLIINRFYVWITLQRNPGLRRYRKSVLEKKEAEQNKKTVKSQLKKKAGVKLE